MSDILIDSEYDLKITNGDLTVGDSFEQEANLLLNSQPGWWRSFPGLGIDIYNYINQDGNYSGAIWNEIKKQFEYDGKILKKFETINNSITLEIEKV